MSGFNARTVLGWIAILMSLIAAGCGAGHTSEQHEPTAALLKSAGTSTGTHHAVGSSVAQPVLNSQSASFISERVGWAWGTPSTRAGQPGTGVLERTSDGGRVWQAVGMRPQISFYSASPRVGTNTSVDFINAHTGYLYGDELWVTHTAGRTWQQLVTPGPVMHLSSSDGHVFAIVEDCHSVQCESAHLYAVDGSQLRNLGPDRPVLAFSSSLVTEGADLYVLTGQGDDHSHPSLWVSHDTGRTWQDESCACACTGFGGETVALAAWSTTGLVAACGGEPSTMSSTKTIRVSTDAGRRWRTAHSFGFSPGQLSGLAALTANTWTFVSSQVESLLVTHNSGRTWTAEPTGHTADFYGFAGVTAVGKNFIDAYPATYGSVLAISANGGRTWHSNKQTAR